MDITQRAWDKADKERPIDRDFLRGAICYYRGYSKLAADGRKNVEIIVNDLARGLNSYVKTSNLLEIDLTMERRFGKTRHKIPSKVKMPKDDLQHWVEVKTKELSKPLKITQDEPFEDKETGCYQTSVPVSNIIMNDMNVRPTGAKDQWKHVFDEETLNRLRVVYEIMQTGVHWTTLDQFVNGFYYDMNPYGEIRIWEKMALVWDLIFKVAPKSPELETGVYAALIMLCNVQVPSNLGLPEELFTSIIHLWSQSEAGLALKAAIDDAHGKSVLTDASAVVTPVAVMRE